MDLWPVRIFGRPRCRWRRSGHQSQRRRRCFCNAEAGWASKVVQSSREVLAWTSPRCSHRKRNSSQSRILSALLRQVLCFHFPFLFKEEDLRDVERLRLQERRLRARAHLHAPALAPSPQRETSSVWAKLEVEDSPSITYYRSTFYYIPLSPIRYDHVTD